MRTKRRAPVDSAWVNQGNGRTDDRDRGGWPLDELPPWVPRRDGRKLFLVILFLVFVLLPWGLLFWSILPKAPDYSWDDFHTRAYSDFMYDVQRNRVSDVTVQGRFIVGHFTDGREFQTYMVEDPSIWQKLNEKGVRVTAVPEYRPPDVIAWFEARPVWLQAMLVVVVLAFVWFLTLAAMWAATPRWLVTLYESLPGPKVIDQITEAVDKRSGGLAKLLRAIGEAALLLLGTSRRARAAWIAHYAPEARAQFGVTTRASQNRTPRAAANTCCQSSAFGN
jgi:hypothetical protein